MGLTQQPAPPVQAPIAEIPQGRTSHGHRSAAARAADGDWLMIGVVRRLGDTARSIRSLSGINVDRLQPRWVFATGGQRGHEAAPVREHGVDVRLDAVASSRRNRARSGTILWALRQGRRRERRAPHPTSRGVALTRQGFLWANDAVLVALNARTVLCRSGLEGAEKT
jgi:hypothetical protein